MYAFALSVSGLFAVSMFCLSPALHASIGARFSVALTSTVRITFNRRLCVINGFLCALHTRSHTNTLCSIADAGRERIPNPLINPSPPRRCEWQNSRARPPKLMITFGSIMLMCTNPNVYMCCACVCVCFPKIYCLTLAGLIIKYALLSLTQTHTYTCQNCAHTVFCWPFAIYVLLFLPRLPQTLLVIRAISGRPYPLSCPDNVLRLRGCDRRSNGLLYVQRFRGFAIYALVYAALSRTQFIYAYYAPDLSAAAANKRAHTTSQPKKPQRNEPIRFPFTYLFNARFLLFAVCPRRLASLAHPRGRASRSPRSGAPSYQLHGDGSTNIM